MSTECKNARAPINISKESVAGSCTDKCDLMFNYYGSSCNVFRSEKYLELDYDDSSKPPVTFNAITLDVYKVRIYCPSLHTFNGEHAPAEIIIAHNGNGSNLLVCVPLMESQVTSECSKMMEKIVNDTEKLAPKVGNRASLNVANYNLNNIVPKLPYFFYEGTLPFPPCNGNYNLVVFHTNTFNTIKKPILDKLKKMLKEHNTQIRSGPELFLSGLSSHRHDSDDIYISCQPVTEGKKVKYQDKYTEEGFSNISDNFMTYSNSQLTMSDHIIPLTIGTIFIFGLLYNRRK